MYLEPSIAVKSSGRALAMDSGGMLAKVKYGLIRYCVDVASRDVSPAR